MSQVQDVATVFVPRLKLTPACLAAFFYLEFCFAHVIDIQNHLICRVSKYKKWLEVRQTLLPFMGWCLGTRLEA